MKLSFVLIALILIGLHEARREDHKKHPMEEHGKPHADFHHSHSEEQHNSVSKKQQSPPQHPPPSPKSPCDVCIHQDALFFEDAFYYISTHSSNTPSTLQVVSEDAFCRHEAKLHPEWTAHMDMETFMTGCSRQYTMASQYLASSNNLMPFDPYAFAQKSCAGKKVCGQPNGPVTTSSTTSDCPVCLRMRTLFAEDEKYFFSFLNRMDDPKSPETVQMFCMTEAKLHPEWVMSGHVDAFLDSCHREYQHVFRDSHKPQDIQPYDYAKYDCEMHKFCVPNGPNPTNPPPPIDTNYPPPPPYDTDYPPPPPFDPKHPPPPPPIDTNYPPPPPIDTNYPPPPPYDTDYPPPPPPFDPKHPPPPPIDTNYPPPPPFDTDHPPPPPEQTNVNLLPFGLDHLLKHH